MIDRIRELLIALAVLFSANNAAGQSIIAYKSITELDSRPAAEFDAGRMRYDNARVFADRVGNYVTGFVGVPGVNQDIDYSTPAWTNSLWTDSAVGTDPLFICRDNTNGAAVWGHVVTGVAATGVTDILGPLSVDGVQILLVSDGDTGGADCTFLGDGITTANTLAGNTVTGKDAFAVASTASWSTITGTRAGQAITEGDSNSLYGWESGQSITTGHSNTYMGLGSGREVTTSESNVGIGIQSAGGLSVNPSTGSFNTFLGYATGQVIESATENTAVGYHSGFTMVSTQNCTFVGFKAGEDCTGNSNTGVGHNSLLQVTTGTSNTAVGVACADAITQGTFNVAVGALALSANLTSSFNCAIGSNALNKVTSGSNTSVGNSSMISSVGAANNTAIGFGALQDNVSGDNNVIIGSQAGKTLEGDGCVIIGFNAGFNVGADDNVLYIDNSNTATPLIGGDFGTDAVTVNGSLTVTNGFHPRVISQDDPPAAGTGATQVDTGELMMWIDTNDSNKVYSVYNNAGTVVVVLYATAP